MKRVILESPYAGNVALNTDYARACLADCLKRGEAPFASHLLYTQPGVLDDDKPEERALGIDAGLVWGLSAEATVVYVDLGISKGMHLGMERAAKEGRPIFRRSLTPEFLAEVVETRSHRVIHPHGLRIFHALFGQTSNVWILAKDHCGAIRAYLDYFDEENGDPDDRRQDLDQLLATMREVSAFEAAQTQLGMWDGVGPERWTMVRLWMEREAPCVLPVGPAPRAKVEPPRG